MRFEFSLSSSNILIIKKSNYKLFLFRLFIYMNYFKIELLLEQMRLCLMRKDFIRASIITKKISKKFFQDKSDAVISFFIFLQKINLKSEK